MQPNTHGTFVSVLLHSGLMVVYTQVMRIPKAVKSIISIVVVVVVLSIIFTHIDVRTIVERVGATKGYLLAVVIALSGGISVFTTASFFSTIGLLSIGGLNPFILGLVTAPALAVGDYFFYYLGKKGKLIIPSHFLNKLEVFEQWLSKRPRYTILFFVFVYAALTPLPSEFLMISLAFLNYPFKKALPVILLGHIAIVTWLGYVAILTAPALGF